LGEFIKKIDRAISDLRKGKFVLIYDDDKREGETDLMIASEFVKPESIRTLRKDGCGLIFLMTSNSVAEKLKLPFLSDMFTKINDNYPVLKELVADDIPYDSKSSFSLYINHRDTYTGITDKDRSLTMKKFADLSKKINNLGGQTAIKLLGENFRSPGHVPICVASKNLLKERKGHTELFVSLLEMADLSPVGSGCEMMGDSGVALSKSDSKKYAREHDYVFLEGKEITEAWTKWSK
jgi:3,4-dihydroxy 2-butanone 4-phosphate synthase